MIIGHVLPDKETSLLDAYEKCRSLADPKVCCDYALHMGITWWAPKVSVAPRSPPSRHHGKAPGPPCPGTAAMAGANSCPLIPLAACLGGFAHPALPFELP